MLVGLTKKSPTRLLPNGGRVGDKPGHPFRGNQWTKGRASARSLGASALKAAREDGGATLSMKIEGANIKSGYVVAEKPDVSLVKPANEMTITDIENWVTKHKAEFQEPGVELGVWHDTESDKFWMDAVTVYPNTQAGRKAAIAAGKKHNQIAIFHLDDMEEIPTGGDGLAKSTTRFAVFNHLDPQAVVNWIKGPVRKMYMVRKATSSDYPVRPAQQGADQRSRQRSNASRTQRQGQQPQRAGYVSSAEHRQRVQAAQKSASKRRKGAGPTKAEARLSKFADSLRKSNVSSKDLVQGPGGISGKDEKTHAAMLRALKMAGVQVNISDDGSGMFVNPDTGKTVRIAAPPGSKKSWTNDGKSNVKAPKIDQFKP